MEELAVGINTKGDFHVGAEFQALDIREQAYIMQSLICYCTSFFSHKDVHKTLGLIYESHKESGKDVQHLFLMSEDGDDIKLKKGLNNMLDYLIEPETKGFIKENIGGDEFADLTDRKYYD